MIYADLGGLSLPGNADPGQGPIQHQGQHFVTVPVLDQIT